MNQKVRLANNATDLENIWGPILQQARSVPIIDFNKDRVVVVFAGQRSTGGYSLSVSGVAGLGGTSALASITESTPAEGSMTTQALTSPWVMFAIERTYLDVAAKFQQVQGNASLPSYQIGPLTTITPLPWSPCGYGFGGGWSDPCGFGFGSPYEFQNWCGTNGIDFPLNYGQPNWGSNRLFFLSGGDYGLGYGLQIGSIFISGTETIVQVTRGIRTPDQSSRGYAMVSLARNVQRIQVEFVVPTPETYIGAGRGQISRPNSILRKADDAASLLRATQVDQGVDLRSFDFNRDSLAVVQPAAPKIGFTHKILRVAYRGNQAIVYTTYEAAVHKVGDVASLQKFFLLKLPKKIRNVRVETI
ncbi:MAG TPA: protease complex subunit PrcB family protein [Fimbriimonas sp.]|nr:protease complex subunit PrcB family protein [Fimbriimonas sp.]